MEMYLKVVETYTLTLNQKFQAADGTRYKFRLSKSSGDIWEPRLFVPNDYTINFYFDIFHWKSEKVELLAKLNETSADKQSF